MKALRLVFLLLLISCTSITEEIYLNSDGSGEYMVYSDVVSSSRDMMLGMMSSIYPDASEDSLRQVVEAQIWADFPAEVDSIIDFTSRVPDSVKNDPESQKYLDKMEMFMRGSKEKGYLNSGMSYKFDAVKDLEDFLMFLNQNQAVGSGGAVGTDVPNLNVKYSFDGNSFSRTTQMEDFLDMSDSTVMMLNVMLQGAKSRFIVHLPRKAKNASSNQLVEQKGKDVIYEFELLKVINGEQSSDVKIDF